MDRRDALKTLFAFVPLGVGFAGITAMGIRFITPNKKEVYRRIFTVSLDELPINATRRFQDLQGKDLVIVRTGEKEVKALPTETEEDWLDLEWDPEFSEKADTPPFIGPQESGVGAPWPFGKGTVAETLMWAGVGIGAYLILGPALGIKK